MLKENNVSFVYCCSCNFASIAAIAWTSGLCNSMVHKREIHKFGTEWQRERERQTASAARSMDHISYAVDGKVVGHLTSH